MKKVQTILNDRCFYSTQGHDHLGYLPIEKRKSVKNLIHKDDVIRIIDIVETVSLKIGMIIGFGVSLFIYFLIHSV